MQFGIHILTELYIKHVNLQKLKLDDGVDDSEFGDAGGFLKDDGDGEPLSLAERLKLNLDGGDKAAKVKKPRKPAGTGGAGRGRGKGNFTLIVYHAQ
jgi:hypothetical protein